MSRNLTRRDFLKGTAAAVATTTLLGAHAFAEEKPAEAPAEQPAEQPEVQRGDMDSVVIDRFVVKPGDGEAFLEYFLKKHAEVFPDCGLTHERTLVFPPVWLKDSSNTIEVQWNMKGSNAFWTVYNRSTRSFPETIAFWKEVNARVEFHDRQICGYAEKLEAMNHV